MAEAGADYTQSGIHDVPQYVTSRDLHAGCPTNLKVLRMLAVTRTLLSQPVPSAHATRRFKCHFNWSLNGRHLIIPTQRNSIASVQSTMSKAAGLSSQIDNVWTILCSYTGVLPSDRLVEFYMIIQDISSLAILCCCDFSVRRFLEWSLPPSL